MDAAEFTAIRTQLNLTHRQLADILGLAEISCKKWGQNGVAHGVTQILLRLLGDGTVSADDIARARQGPSVSTIVSDDISSAPNVTSTDNRPSEAIQELLAKDKRRPGHVAKQICKFLDSASWEEAEEFFNTPVQDGGENGAPTEYKEAPREETAASSEADATPTPAAPGQISPATLGMLRDCGVDPDEIADQVNTPVQDEPEADPPPTEGWSPELIAAVERILAKVAPSAEAEAPSAPIDPPNTEIASDETADISVDIPSDVDYSADGNLAAELGCDSDPADAYRVPAAPQLGITPLLGEQEASDMKSNDPDIKVVHYDWGDRFITLDGREFTSLAWARKALGR